MNTKSKSATVLVSGGSGYLASHIIQQLLNGGHTVHTTVRDLSNKQKYAHLIEIADRAPGKLKVFEADLLKPGSFEESVQGCSRVIHTASPFIIGKVKDPRKTLVDPALEGTRNILEAVNKTESVEKVVLTSSLVAIMGDHKDAENIADGIFNEENWNTTSNLDHQPYSYSKTLAEKEAWKMARAQSRWSLVVMNPGFMLGPSLTKRNDSASIDFMASMGNGTYKTGAPEGYLAIVDVRDAAEAHINGAMNGASGRHLLSAEVLSFHDVAGILHKEFSDYPLPRRKVPKWLFVLIGPMFGLSRKYILRNIGIPLKVDNSRSKKSLNLAYRPIGETLTDQFHQLIEDGLLKDQG